jgi:hypothetical protein
MQPTISMNCRIRVTNALRGRPGDRVIDRVRHFVGVLNMILPRLRKTKSLSSRR